MEPIEFTIPGRLKGKGRHRSRIGRNKRGQQFVQTYPDKDTTNAEAMVRGFGADAMAGRPALTCACVLDVTLTLNRPQSWSKRKRAENPHPTGKPDLDNIAKLIGDALNGIVWRDDAQLCEVRIRRVFDDTTGESARVSVRRAHYIDPVEGIERATNRHSLSATPLFAKPAYCPRCDSAITPGTQHDCPRPREVGATPQCEKQAADSSEPDVVEQMEPEAACTA